MASEGKSHWEDFQVFEANGKQYRVDKLWDLARDLPEKNVTVGSSKYLQPMEAGWANEVEKPLDLLKDPKLHPGHWERVQKADLSHPVIMSPDGWVADGMHRMLKAKHLGHKAVRIKQFKNYKQMEPALIKGSSDPMGWLQSISKTASNHGIRLPEGGIMKKQAARPSLNIPEPMIPQAPMSPDMMDPMDDATVPAEVMSLSGTQRQSELEAWQRWKTNPNQDDFRFLLKSYEPLYLGSALSKRFLTTSRLPKSAVQAELIQNFHRALETYDPSKGAALPTHIWHHLKRTGRFLRTYTNIGKIPDPRALQIGQFQARESYLSEVLGRQPSTLELADQMSIDPKEIELLRKELRKDIPMDDVTSGLADVATPVALERLQFLHMELNPEQQLVLEHTYGMYGRQAVDNNERLAQVLNITPQKIRAIKRQIAKRFEKRYG